MGLLPLMDLADGRLAFLAKYGHAGHQCASKA